MPVLILFLILIYGVTLRTFLLFDYKQKMAVDAHKLLRNNDNDNSKFTSALIIPNHTISWAVYQQLDGKEGIDARFYKFNNSQINSSFYAQIVVPKIEQFANFTPSLMLLEPKSYKVGDNNISSVIKDNNLMLSNNTNNPLPFGIPTNYQIIINQDYNETLPSSTFYEPFTQTSYWERQEINTNLNKLGTYYIVVFNNYDNDITSGNNVSNYKDKPELGKFSLAVGKIEDFSILDLFILIPYSWMNVKLFFNDYLSLTLGVSIFVLVVIVLPIVLIKRRKRN